MVLLLFFCSILVLLRKTNPDTEKDLWLHFLLKLAWKVFTSYMIAFCYIKTKYIFCMDINAMSIFCVKVFVMVVIPCYCYVATKYLKINTDQLIWFIYFWEYRPPKVLPKNICGDKTSNAYMHVHISGVVIRHSFERLVVRVQIFRGREKKCICQQKFHIKHRNLQDKSRWYWVSFVATKN